MLSHVKSEFAKRNLQYLGLQIIGDTTILTTNHLRKITGHALPRTYKELQSFLGSCDSVRDYVPRYVEIIAPMTDLLSSKKPYA